jgi:hypothetical protein
MAINWTTLTASKSTAGSIANWLNRSDLPMENILLEAEAWIYQRLRVREMTTADLFTFGAGESTEALPSGFLDPISFKPYAWGSTALPYVHEDSFRERRDDDGNLAEDRPSQWTIIGETAHVDCICEEAFGGRLLYYKQPAPLSSSNETNFLTTRYPTLVRSACMMRGFEHMKHAQNAVAYMQKAEADIAEAMRTNDMFRRAQMVAS